MRQQQPTVTPDPVVQNPVEKNPAQKIPVEKSLAELFPAENPVESEPGVDKRACLNEINMEMVVVEVDDGRSISR